MKYSKELHERVRQNLRMFDYPRFDDGDIDTLLDEIERLQAEHRWIPVSERLPEVNSHVLVSMLVNDAITNGDTARIVESSGYNGERFVCFLGEFVTHWMPLPTPPEGE